MMLCRHDPNPFIGPNGVLCSESGVHCFLSMIFIHSIQFFRLFRSFYTGSTFFQSLFLSSSSLFSYYRTFWSYLRTGKPKIGVVSLTRVVSSAQPRFHCSAAKGRARRPSSELCPSFDHYSEVRPLRSEYPGRRKILLVSVDHIWQSRNTGHC
ncbi:hypothetical protein ARMGADRAFT_572379 [Armillaria gallica]|uniref:Uncharacterized protein n=1 Tax=Armillaria gallica TaxID=47427 RepID=A0A2H3E3G7_ARMGA|nr:hypothetical protein ARMGADRAFT_572379 [Armillaria gallica]